MDEVIADVPYFIEQDYFQYIIKEHNIDFVVHGVRNLFCFIKHVEVKIMELLCCVDRYRPLYLQWRRLLCIGQKPRYGVYIGNSTIVLTWLSLALYSYL